MVSNVIEFPADQSKPITATPLLFTSDCSWMGGAKLIASERKKRHAWSLGKRTVTFLRKPKAASHFLEL